MKAFAKTGQAFPTAFHGFWGEVAVHVQITPLPNGFFQVVSAHQLAMLHAPQLQAETVGSQVYGGKDVLMGHWDPGG
jgi:hypothetical protein